jgi:hypothetical protein
VCVECFQYLGLRIRAFAEHRPAGMNTVVKLAPYLPLTESFDSNDSLSDEDLELLVSMGMNALRMNVPWSAVEVHKDGIW